MTNSNYRNSIVLGSLSLLLATLSVVYAQNTNLRGSWAMSTPCTGPNSTCGPQGICGFPDIYNNVQPCVFANTVYNWTQVAQDKLSQCKVCTQSTDARCTNASLKAGIIGSGIKLAYCNDESLIYWTDGTPSYTTNLFSIPFPPRAVDIYGDSCVGRYSSSQAASAFRIPLTFTALNTSTQYNNIDNGGFPANTYINASGVIYGVPEEGSVGITIDGQSIFPAFNNMGGFGQEECEVGECFEHVGQGGGQPHIHGDPFGPSCLYSASNYTTTGHPPLIGWSRDGAAIYGRYLSTSSLGYNTSLDDCGGHTHDTLGYHYHTQVINTTSRNAFPNHPTGVNYALFSPGVYKCWKGDITAIPNFWGLDQQIEKDLDSPCCSQTNFYSPYTTTTTTTSSSSKAQTNNRKNHAQSQSTLQNLIEGANRA